MSVLTSAVSIVSLQFQSIWPFAFAVVRGSSGAQNHFVPRPVMAAPPFSPIVSSSMEFSLRSGNLQQEKSKPPPTSPDIWNAWLITLR